MARRKIKEVKNRKNNVKQKKEGRIGQIVIGGIIIFLMVVSIAGVSVYNNNDDNNLKFNDYQFKKGTDNLIYTTINGQEMSFRAMPQQTLNIIFEDKEQTLELLRNSQYYATLFNPELPTEILSVIEITRFELGNNIPTAFPAVTSPSSLYPNAPVLSCLNASKEIPFIKFVFLNDTYDYGNISLNGNCITIEGDARGILIAKDRLVYEYYDVFKVEE